MTYVLSPATRDVLAALEERERLRRPRPSTIVDRLRAVYDRPVDDPMEVPFGGRMPNPAGWDK